MTIVTMGESLGVVRATMPGGLGLAGGAELGIGGAESNVAIAAARLGHSTRWIGRVGDDAIGRRVIRTLRGEGVDVRARVEESAPTGLILKDTARPGSTDVVYYRANSAGSRLDTGDVEAGGIDHGCHLHLTGITLAISNTARDSVLTAASIAARAGATVSFDINHRSRLWPALEAAPWYRKVAAQCDVLFGGEDELRLLAHGDTPEQLARAASALGPAIVVVKRGDRGAGALVAGEWHQMPATSTTVVDTVGAGDAFAAAYLVGWLAGIDPTERLRRAIRNGALACTHPGDWEGSATAEELIPPSSLRARADPVRR